VGLSWTSRFVLRTNFRACPHTQLNINESVSTAGKARPGGTAIYGIKAIGQPSDAWSATSASVADERASRVQNTKGIHPLDVKRYMGEDYQQRCEGDNDAARESSGGVDHVFTCVCSPSATVPPRMSLADALNPQLSGNGPVGEVYLAHDAKQPPPIDQDEEMDDLFDEDAVVDQAERYSSISPPTPYSILFIDSTWELSHRNASVSDGGQADAISDAEQRHREAMEYAEEEDEPDQDNGHALLEQRTEASALLPNIPSPRSSDGQVHIPPSSFVGFPLTCPRVGSLGCPTLLKWILNHFILTLTLVRTRRMKSSRELRTVGNLQ